MPISLNSLYNTRFIDNGGLEITPVIGTREEVADALIHKTESARVEGLLMSLVNESLSHVNLNIDPHTRDIIRFGIKIPGSRRIIDGISIWSVEPAYLLAERSIEIFEQELRGRGFGKRVGWLMNYILKEAGFKTAYAFTSHENHISNAHLSKHFGRLVNSDANTNYYACDLQEFNYPAEFSPVQMKEV